EAVQEFRSDAPPRLLVEENLASNSEDTSVDSLCLRQKLPTHPRGAAVGCDQNVAEHCRAILEMRDNAAGRAFLVAHKRFAEMHHAFEDRQRSLPQRDAADRAMLGNGVEALRRIQLIDCEQDLSALGDEADAFARLAAGARKGVE